MIANAPIASLIASLVSKRRASSAFDLRAFEKKLSIFCSHLFIVATLFSQDCMHVKNFYGTFANKIFNPLILNEQPDPVPSAKAGYAPLCPDRPQGPDRFAAAFARLDVLWPSMRSGVPNWRP